MVRERKVSNMAKKKEIEPQVTSRWYKAPSDRIYIGVVYVMLTLLALLVLVIFAFILASSFSSAEAIAGGSRRPSGLRKTR